MNNKINKQKGIILPVVLIFFSFLMLLGVTFVSVGGFQVTQSMSQVNRSQAFYLAQSGAKSVAEYILEIADDYNDVDTFKSAIVTNGFKTSQLSDSSGNFSNLNGILKIQVAVFESSSSYIDITSRAEVKGESSESNLRLKLLSSGSSGINEGEAIILVDASLNGNDKNKIEIYNNILEEQKKINYPIPVFPSDNINILDQSDVTFITSPSSKIISQSVYFESLIVKSGNDLVIDFDGYNSNDILIIRVKNLDVDGSIHIINTITGSAQKVIFFVEEILEFGKNKNVNINQTGDADPNNLVILYAGVQDFEAKNDFDFNGLIYAPNSTFTIRNNNNIKGAVVIGGLKVNGNKPVVDARDIQFILPVEFFDGHVVGSSLGFGIDFDDNPWN